MTDDHIWSYMVISIAIAWSAAGRGATLTLGRGQWNLGSATMEYTPTYRGFGTFLGYYAAAVGESSVILLALPLRLY